MWKSGNLCLVAPGIFILSTYLVILIYSSVWMLSLIQLLACCLISMRLQVSNFIHQYDVLTHVRPLLQVWTSRINSRVTYWSISRGLLPLFSYRSRFSFLSARLGYYFSCYLGYHFTFGIMLLLETYSNWLFYCFS